MKRLQLCLCLSIMCATCYAQAAQAPATPDELTYFSYILMTLGSPDHSPEFIKTAEDSLVHQFGVNQQEAAIIRAAAQSFRAVVQELEKSARSIWSDKTTLSPADSAALEALRDRGDKAVATLANQILNTVRPETADRLRVPGRVVASALQRAKGR